MRCDGGSAAPRAMLKQSYGSAAIFSIEQGTARSTFSVIVDFARPMAAINTGLQTGGGACERGLSRLNGFWFATSGCTSLKRGVSDIGGMIDSTLSILPAELLDATVITCAKFVPLLTIPRSRVT